MSSQPRSTEADRDRTDPLPCALAIFGAVGDLSLRKLLPSLYRLWCQKHLHPKTVIIGVARRDFDDNHFRGVVGRALDEHLGPDATRSPEWQEFSQRLHFASFDLTDSSGFVGLRDRLETLATPVDTPHRVIFYMSTPPELFPTVLEGLGAAGLATSRHDADGVWPRAVIEKPFGSDQESSRSLNRLLLQCFHEDQIYRIDHYLGKESVQNLLVFRFGNTIYESIWNRRYVDHVQITVAETLGVESRGRTYEQMGALRDIVQNHITQLLATIAMEPPTAFDARHVRNEKTKVIEAIRRTSQDDLAASFVRGQYTVGHIDGRDVPGYVDEEGVAPRSVTETFVAAKLYVDTWRWSGVPFYVRTGKRLSRRVTEVAIHFKEPPMLLFRNHADDLRGNVLAMRIQPDEGISLGFMAKTPGVAMDLASVEMNFRYREEFHQELADAYETLLLDVIQGDQMLFAPMELHDAAWAVMTPVIEAWEATLAPMFRYQAGTRGPEAADALITTDGRRWRPL